MKFQTVIFAVLTLGFLVTSCSPQSIDDQTTQDNIKAQTEMDKTKIIVPRNG